MTAHITRRAARRLAGAVSAMALVGSAVAGLSIAAATPALAGCTSQAVTVLTIHKTDEADGHALAGAQFSATTTTAGMRLAAPTGSTLATWNRAVTAGLAASSPTETALTQAMSDADQVTPVTAMGTRATLTTDASGNAALLVRQLCGYDPATATVTLTETVAPAGYDLLPSPIVLTVPRPQVPTPDKIAVASGPDGVTLSDTAVHLVATTKAPDETSSFGRGTLTVPDPVIEVLPTSATQTSPTTSSVQVLPTSASQPPTKTEMAYTGVPAWKMGWTALVLLAAGGALVLLGARRRRGRAH